MRDFDHSGELFSSKMPGLIPVDFPFNAILVVNWLYTFDIQKRYVYAERSYKEKNPKIKDRSIKYVLLGCMMHNQQSV